MRITQERLDSNLRVTKVELAISRAILAVIEEDPELTEAEVAEAMSNKLHRQLSRARHSETKPYEGYEESSEDE